MLAGPREERAASGSIAAPYSPARMTWQSAVNMAGGIISQGLKFLVMIYVARRFSTAEFGLVAFAWSIQAFMLVASHFGLPIYGAREIARSGRVPARLLADVAISRAGLSLAGTLAALALLSGVSGVSHSELFLVAMFGLSNVAQAFFFDWAFQGLQRLESSAAINILWQALWLGFTWLGIRLGGDVRMVGVALLLSTGVASAVGYVWLRWTTNVQSYASAGGLFRDSWETLTLGASLGTGTVLVSVLLWADTITVRILRGEEAVGIYAAGNRAALALAMLSTFYVQGAFPLLSQAADRSRAEFSRIFHHAYADLAALYLPGSIWAIAYAREIIAFIFGRADYMAAVPVFQLFQVLLLILVANGLLGTGVLVSFHRDKIFQKALTWTAVAYLLLCPLFTWRWGLIGAASAGLVSQIVAWMILRKTTRQLVQLHHLSALLAPLLMGIALSAGDRLLHLRLIPAAATTVLAYLVFLSLRIKQGRAVSELT